jgi:hypothetical protein
MHRCDEWVAAIKWVEWVYILCADVCHVWDGIPFDSEVEISE